MSSDPSKEYFSDGVTEDIITDLAKVAGLIVIARNSSFAYKGKRFDIRDVARELNVRFVLEGSIRHAANRVRVTAQLIDAGSGAHLWAERYDRDLTDIFAVQDDVTQKIVSALKVTLSPAEKARIAEAGVTNVEAHDCYIRARELLMGGTQNRDIFEQAIVLLDRAVELDPNYAQAYAGLAWAYILDFTNQWSQESDRSLGLARVCRRSSGRERLRASLSLTSPARWSLSESAIPSEPSRRPTPPSLSVQIIRLRAAYWEASNCLRVARSKRSRRWSAICGLIPSSASKGSSSSAWPI